MRCYNLTSQCATDILINNKLINNIAAALMPSCCGTAILSKILKHKAWLTGFSCLLFYLLPKISLEIFAFLKIFYLHLFKPFTLFILFACSKLIIQAAFFHIQRNITGSRRATVDTAHSYAAIAVCSTTTFLPFTDCCSIQSTHQESHIPQRFLKYLQKLKHKNKHHQQKSWLPVVL